MEKVYLGKGLGTHQLVTDKNLVYMGGYGSKQLGEGQIDCVPRREGVDSCRKWIYLWLVKSDRWLHVSSYGFKHIVETHNYKNHEKPGYVSNGEFILAMLEAAYETAGGYNCYFKCKVSEYAKEYKYELEWERAMELELCSSRTSRVTWDQAKSFPPPARENIHARCRMQPLDYVGSQVHFPSLP